MPKRLLVQIDDRELAITNPGKVLWPGEGYTKADLIKYYAQVAPYLLPYLYQRPLTVVRYPDGITGHSFYQKNLPSHAPPWIPTATVTGKHGTIRYPLCHDRATLVWLANQAAIELHPWHSQLGSPDHPDWVVIDLDPNAGATYEMVIEVAMAIKALLDRLELTGYPKTSGVSGLHIYIPLEQRYSYHQAASFAEQIGKIIAGLLPRVATNERWIKDRGPRVYIDHLQNLPGKTIVAPYSLRPQPGAPVSMPLRWEEVTTARPQDFTLTTALSRLAKTGDLFRPVLTQKQSLDKAFSLFPQLVPLSRPL